MISVTRFLSTGLSYARSNSVCTSGITSLYNPSTAITGLFIVYMNLNQLSYPFHRNLKSFSIGMKLQIYFRLIYSLLFIFVRFIEKQCHIHLIKASSQTWSSIKLGF